MTWRAPGSKPGFGRFVLGWSVLALGVLTLLAAEEIVVRWELEPWLIGGRPVPAPVPPALLAILCGVVLVKSWTRALRRIHGSN
jgi:hypothetical protein